MNQPAAAVDPATFTSTSLGKGMPKLSRKNQVTIPVSVLRKSGLEPGDEVRVRAVGRGRLELERWSDLIDRFAGSLPSGAYPPGYLEGLRSEWER
jgi:bifunctional DNA-binding transcriptional regulator/antitoxin component of YhaV-PrlF toxin-antitoxin module